MLWLSYFSILLLKKPCTSMDQSDNFKSNAEFIRNKTKIEKENKRKKHSIIMAMYSSVPTHNLQYS